MKGGMKVIYVILVKALYGCIKSALFNSTLKEVGFELNPQGSCIANCTVNGKQCAIEW